MPGAADGEARAQAPASGGPASEPESGCLPFRQAVEASGEVIFLTDRDGTFTYVNPEFTRLYGWEAGEVVGRRTPRVLKSGTHPPEVYEALWGTLLAGRVARGELANRTKAGDLVTVASSANPIVGDSGEIVGFVAIQRDVTRARRAEGELARMKLAVDRAVDMFLWIDAAGRLTYANDTARSALGYARDEIEGLRVWDVDPLFDEGSWSQRWERVREHGSRTLETVFRSKDGVEIPVQVSITHHCFEGAELGFVNAHDLRERRELTAQLQQAQKMEAVGQLAGGIAHDFNNILAVILSYASFLQDGLEEADPLRADAEEVLGAAKRAAALTSKLLAFSRKQVLEPKVVAVNDVVAGLEKILRRLLGERIALETAPDPDAGLVFVDVAQLEQVLINLAVNARDAMPEGGVLRIATGRQRLDEADPRVAAGLQPGPYAVVTVADDGVGMDADTASRAFEPFFTTKGAERGTGLGLSTSYGTIRQSGGDLTVSTAPGRGSTFTLLLPEARPSAARPEPTPSAPPAGGARATVLVVEDEVAVRRAVTRILRGAGYEVLVSSEPGEALILAEQREGPIHLLLTDIVMPHLTGVELADRLRATRPDLPTILMTGYVDVKQHATGVSSGNPIVRKPFTPAELLAHVRKVLG